MKAVVTGAAGFIGSKIVRALLEEGATVTGIDRFSDYYDSAIKRSNIKDIESRSFNLIEASLLESDLEALLAGSEVVFHQAGQPGVRPSWGDSFNIYVDDNIRSTQKLLEAVSAATKPPKMVYASSSSVYGDAASFPTAETAVPRPRSPYGVTKLAAEHLVNLYAANRGLQTVSLRYFTVYGPGQRPDMAFTRLCHRAARGESIDVYGTGDQIRDFTFVDDVVRANLLAATRDTDPGTVLNIAGGSSVSLNECIEILERISGGPIARVAHPPAPGDVFQTGAETTAAFNTLGWRPTVALADGLAAQYEWVQRQL